MLGELWFWVNYIYCFGSRKVINVDLIYSIITNVYKFRFNSIQ